MRRRSSSSNDQLIGLAALVVIYVVALYMALHFISENPWTRWFIFTGFTVLLVFCIRNVARGITSRQLNLNWLINLAGDPAARVDVINEGFRGGEHTRKILESLGYAPDMIDRLVSTEVVSCALPKK